MKDVPITCPECDGKCGWPNMEGLWVECALCEGKGWVDEDSLGETGIDEDDE